MTGLCSSTLRTLLGVAFCAICALAQTNINTANIKELTAAGLSRTQAINVIKYRKAHKFKSINELEKVRGISFAQAQNLKEKLYVSAPAKKDEAKKNVKKTEKKRKTK